MSAEPLQPGRRASVNVLVFGASLSSKSLNVRLASLVADVVRRNGGAVDFARMEDLDCPSYDADLEMEAGIPPGAQAFKARLLAADAFIVSAPEYNGSMAGVLKNAIDWTSRFRPQPFHGKQAMLLSASPSMAGGKPGLWALRVPLEHLGARVYPDMFSLAKAHEGFGGDGRLANPKLAEWFEQTIVSFLDVVEATKHYACLKSHWVEFLGEQPDRATEREQTAQT